MEQLHIIFGLLCLIFIIVYIKNNNKIQNLQFELSRTREKQSSHSPKLPMFSRFAPPPTTTVVYEPSSSTTALVDALAEAQATIAATATVEEPVVVEEPIVEEPIVEEPVVEEPVVEEPVVEGFNNTTDKIPQPNDDDFDNSKNTFAYY